LLVVGILDSTAYGAPGVVSVKSQVTIHCEQ